MWTRIRRTRPPIKTVEQGVEFLRQWTSAHLDDAAPVARPWRNVSPRERDAVAESLMKVRALYDAGVNRG